EYLPEDRIGVVILTRDKSKIVESMLRVGCCPLNARGREWITTPAAKNPLVRPPSLVISPRVTYSFAYSMRFAVDCARSCWRKVFRADLAAPRWLKTYNRECLNWYVDEVAAQAKAYQQRFKRIKYYSVDLDSLNAPKEVRLLLDYFGCTPTESLTGVIGKAT